MKIKNSTLILILQFLFFLSLAVLLNKSMFDAGSQDGFFSQITYAYSEIFAGPSHPMYFIHLLRLFVALPFYLIYINDLPIIFESIILFFYMLPILTYRENSRFYISGFIFLLLPWVFSFRSVLAMCAICYLYISFFGSKRHMFLYIFSGILANLSSGVVLAWVIINVFCLKTIYFKYKLAIIFFVLGCIGFIVSVVNKIHHFFIMSGGENNESLFTNNTFYVSYHQGDSLRLAVYVLLSVSLLLLLITSSSNERINQKFLFFMIAATPTMFFEGIGLVSFLFIFIWSFVCGVPKRQTGHLK
jgi:hypothetical protein